MNHRTIPGIILVAGLGAVGAGWVFFPALLSVRSRVDGDAEGYLEQARATLHGYNHGLRYEELQLERLAGCDGDDCLVDLALSDADDLMDRMADDYQQWHAERWEAFPPYDYPEATVDTLAGPREARASYGNVVRQATEGLRRRDALMDRNAGLLDDALSAVEKALAITREEASSHSHAEASRLKGVILFHRAMVDRVQAQTLRREAITLRRKLADLGARSMQLAEVASGAESAGAESAGVETQITTLQETLADSQSALQADREEATKLDKTIADLEGHLSAAQARADDARNNLDTLKQNGIDLTDPNGSTAFATTLTGLDRSYRQALREIAAFQFGTYPNAVIDSTGDLLGGAYVENGNSANLTVAFGLQHYHHDRAALAADIEIMASAIAGLETDLVGLEGLRDENTARAKHTRQQIERLKEDAQDVFDDLNARESEAFSIEASALTVFGKSAAASKTSARAIQDWMNSSSEAAAKVSSESRAMSAYQTRSGARWLGGFVTAQQADAWLGRAWIEFDRYVGNRRTAGVLDRFAEALALGEADPSASHLKSSDAHDAAVEAISQAVSLLRQAHRDGDRHWTYVAQKAGADYLMVLLGHPEYEKDATEAYRSALQQREDEKYTEKLVARLRELESR